MNIFEPELQGIGQVTEHYNQCVDKIVFRAECDPSDVIREVIKRAEHARTEEANKDENKLVDSY